MPGVPREYLGLMRDAMKEESNPSSPSGQRPLKKRRRNKRDTRNVSVESSDQQDAQGNPSDQAIVVESSGDDGANKSKSNMDLNSIPVIVLSDSEDTPHAIDQLKQELNSNSPSPSQMNDETIVVDGEEGGYDDDDDDDDFDEDEFEDVDLNEVKPKASSTITGDVNFSVNKDDPKKKKKTRTKNVIDKEERIFRKNFHRNYVAIMAIHGFIRNKWCNDKTVNDHMLKLIPSSVYDELHPSKSAGISQIRTRRFLDGLRHLLERWSKYYKVTSNKGIYRHGWYEWYGYEKSAVTFQRFVKCIAKGRGNRDIGAQGFVALLRAADVPSRLVFSLQPPDFTSMAIKEKPQAKVPEPKNKTGPKSAQEKLLELRKGKVSSSLDRPVQAEIEMKYPVFWAEAWDSASKTWITIDPIQFKIIENVKSKSRLEPPSNYPYNNLIYVLGYDRKGGVRDITKRYAEKYYARTRKKRITKDESEEIWYNDFLEKLSARERNRSDDYEDEYFNRKATLEGMPDNIQDFKNHPFYVLESHLRSNEILYPKEHCGMIRTKGKNNSIKVYKRENVQLLRTPRAWFQKGRVLKSGERAMLVRKKTPAQMKDDDDDPDERLYAIFQTSIYVPPPVKDGLITKNGYGNIDVYVPSMIPEGGVLIRTPFAAEAAKLIGVDYAPAVVGFNFERRGATPKIEGIVVGEDFREAIETIQEQLKQEELERQRSELEIRALKGWALLLAKLRIKQRLNAHHGKVDEEGDQSEEEYDRLEKEYEGYIENDDEDRSDASEEENVSDYGPGGFIVEQGAQQFDQGVDSPRSGSYGSENSEGFGAGGFMKRGNHNSHEGYERESGRSSSFDPRESGGGFFNEAEANQQPQVTGFDDSDSELYHPSGGFIQEGQDEEDIGDAGGFIREGEEEPDEVLQEKRQEQGEDSFGDMDEYEAFFDQLKNNDDAGSEGEDGGQVIEDENSEPSKVTEIVELSIESDAELDATPEVIDKAVETKEHLPSIDNSNSAPGSELNIDHELTEQAANDEEEGNGKFPIEEVENVEKKVLFDEDNEELERQFNEQLKNETEQNLSQLTQEGSQNEDYEFDYDSE